MGFGHHDFPVLTRVQTISAVGEGRLTEGLRTPGFFGFPSLSFHICEVVICIPGFRNIRRYPAPVTHRQCSVNTHPGPLSIPCNNLSGRDLTVWPLQSTSAGPIASLTLEVSVRHLSQEFTWHLDWTMADTMSSQEPQQKPMESRT